MRDHGDEVCCVSSTQVGKTFAYSCKLLAAMWEYSGPHPWWWCAPTYRQSKAAQRVMHHIASSAGIMERGPKPPFEQNPPPSLVLINGKVCEFRTWDDPAHLMGDPIAGAVIDEGGLITRDAYKAITSRRSFTLGPVWWIGNPGPVDGLFNEVCERADAAGKLHRWTWRTMYEWALKENPDWAVQYRAFIENERATLRPAHFRTLYEAEVADYNELPVYTFDRQVHVSPELATYEPSIAIDLSCDFNVDPMCWVLGQRKADRAWAFDEIALPGGATTEDACKEFLRRFPSEKISLTVYGDSSGKARSTRSHGTDYEIIRELLGKRRQFSMDVPPANPPVVDRVNAFNAMLSGANGDCRYHVHPSCRNLINDLARVSWRAGTRDIDKSDKSLTHASDADGYRLAVLFPVKPPAALVAVGGAGQHASIMDAKF